MSTRSRVWKVFVGLSTVGTLLVAVAALYDWFTPARPALGIDIEAVTPVLAERATAVGDVSVVVDGRSLASPFIVVARVSNTGSVPLVREAFESPVRIAFPAAKARKVTVDTKEPGDLDFQAEIIEDQAVLRCGLMNPGDWVRVSILAEGSAAAPRASARIMGVRRIDVADATAADTRRPAVAPFIIPMPRLVTIVLAYIPLFWLLLILTEVPALCRKYQACEGRASRVGYVVALSVALVVVIPLLLAAFRPLVLQWMS